MMQGFRKSYERLLEWVVIGLMLILAVEVIIGVVFRTFGEALVWYDEVASILLAWLTFYGSALAAAKRNHISCPEVVAMMPPVWRTAVTLVVEGLVIGFFALIGWLGWQVLGVLESDYLISLPEVSVMYVQSVIPISAALIIVSEVLTLGEALAWARSEHAAGATAESAAHEASH